MKIFLKRLLLLIGINVGLYLLVVNYPVWRHDFSNGNSESVLLVMPKDQDFDVVFMGTSHSRTFSRSGNHQRVENILGGSLFNLSKGGGHGGIVPEKIFLETFFDRGNRTRTIVYFVDPWVFFSNQWNEKNHFLSEEPYSYSLVAKLLLNDIPSEVIVNYLKTKVFFDWINMQPGTSNRENGTLDHIDPVMVQERVTSLYPDGMDNATFKKYSNQFAEILTLAEEHQSEILLVIPPTLLGDMPGEQLMKDFLFTLKNSYRVDLNDLSSSIPDPRYYYNYDHLNSSGVELFMKNYIRPLLPLLTD